MDTTQLNKLIRAQQLLVAAEVYLAHMQEDLAAAKVRLTPDLGWEGKNEEARKVSAEKAYLDSAPIQALVQEIGKVEYEIAGHRADIFAVETLRRQEEWDTRKRLADLLGARKHDILLLDQKLDEALA